MQYEVLREELIAARKRAGLTQQALADALEKPQSFVSKLESGERRLDVVEFLAVVNVLGIAPDEIIRAVEAAEQQDSR